MPANRRGPSAGKSAGIAPEAGVIESIVHNLMPWYFRSARDLPWRHTQDPYAIWVSEIMLQQTQVVKVIPYWLRWMQAFPDVVTLAAADIQDVLFLWQGLGYYSRARHLHQAAQQIVQEFGGHIPSEPSLLSRLSGIGPYTCGAIASIAFERPEPILDGNVTRVLTRLFCLEIDVALATTRSRLWDMAGQLVRCADSMRSPTLPRPCSTLNQALMELGATVCSPSQPDCHSCPLHKLCLGAAKGIAADLPIKKQPSRKVTLFVTAWIIQRNRETAILQLQENQWNHGLFEFPTTMEKHGFSDFRILAESLPLPVLRDSLVEIGSVNHAITHHKIRIRVVKASASKQSSQHLPDSWRWMPRSGFESVPWSGAHRKILSQLE